MDLGHAPVVAVVGSANTDLTVTADRLPAPGETVLGRHAERRVGGKGLNQAIAAACAGAAVEFVGAVGADEAAAAVLATLSDHGVDVSRVRRAGDTTGTALVVVDDAGHNQIVVVPGANARLTAQDVREALTGLVAGDVVVVQGETAAPVLEAAADRAHETGARLVVNLAPVVPVDDRVIERADPLVVNELEAATILGSAPLAGTSDAEHAARTLAGRSRSVVVTLGAQGAVVAQAGRTHHVPASTGVPVVDTTGAGDAFVGVLAAELARRTALVAAATLATTAASATVGSPGASASYQAIAGALATARDLQAAR